jgi:hypothetical protein
MEQKTIMLLFYDPTGPLIQYADGMIEIHDLNPEIYTCWRMSRMEMLRLGWRCILAALTHKG